MARGYLPTLLALGAIWGASFLFIEVAERALQPTTLMAARLLVSAAVLFPVLIASMGLRPALSALRAAAGTGLVAGIIAAALPFTLIAWGQEHIDSGTAAIANASMPIFVVLLALRVRRSERVSGLRLVGVILGLVGVGVLAGANPSGGWWAVVGTLAVVLAAFSYAVGAFYAQHHIDRMSVLVFSTAQCIAGGLVLLPFGLAQMPGHAPGWKPIGSVLALGVAGTAIGTLLYYRLVESHGSTRASLVVYLLPPFALVYGAVFLDEPFRVAKLAGMALILGGVALGSGLLAMRGRSLPAAAARSSGPE
jgi:drug/metabolite transporter (DMT)-like permease